MTKLRKNDFPPLKAPVIQRMQRGSFLVSYDNKEYTNQITSSNNSSKISSS